MGPLWHELTGRWHEERTISYTESHDQALVGDKTLRFRMADAAMYDPMRVGWVCVFNFHPVRAFPGYGILAPGGSYRMVLDTDAEPFGGHGRLAADQVHHTLDDGQTPGGSRLSLYLPFRTGMVLRPAIAESKGAP